MASNTPNLDLLKKDPATDGNDTFNIQTMLNDNWDKIDEAVGQVREEIQDIDIPLSNATNGTRSDVAASEKAVKAAYDRGTEGVNAAVTVQTNLTNFSNTVTTQLVDKASKTYVNEKPWQKHRLTQDSGVGIDISGADLDTVFNSGQYLGASLLNTPNSVAHWWYIEVFQFANTDFCMQRATMLENTVPTMYMRMRYAGQWYSWSLDLFQSGVNAKNSIADAINAKGVLASANDTWSLLASKIGQIASVGLGHSAQGTIISSAGTISVQRPNSTQSTVSVVTYTNLTFKPKFILLTSGTTLVIYSVDLNYGGNAAADILIFLGGSLGDYKLDGPLAVTATGFGLPVPSNMTSTSFTWWAYD
ncbi:Phage tail fiber repeat protein [compost metagenome]